MKYAHDPLLEIQVKHIITSLGMSHIDPEKVRIIRSRGTKSRRILARIHTISKAVQKGLGLEPHYVIEVISENFDRLPLEEKTKTLIHELMHVPHCFGGGFRHHRPHVNRRTVDRMYNQYVSRKS